VSSTIVPPESDGKSVQFGPDINASAISPNVAVGHEVR
jgi:hypothetical protein